MPNPPLQDMKETAASAERQFVALHESAGLVNLSHEEVFELSGSDRRNFLNSYNSQDIQSLQEYQATTGAFLTQKGKLISDCFILNFPDKILLLLQPGYGKKLQEHLATFLMFAKVNLEDASQHWGHLALLGPQAGPLLRNLFYLKDEVGPGILQKLEFEGEPLLIFQSSRLGLAGWEILGTPEIIKSLTHCLLKTASGHGLVAIQNEVLEMIRVEAGLPKIGVDMGEENLVAEVGLDKSATSFNKGCYLGQETTARVQSRGHVNRKLVQLKTVGPTSESPLQLPLEIFQGEKAVGHLTSLVYSMKWKTLLGLGIVQLQALESGEKIYFNTSKGPIELQKI